MSLRGELKLKLERVPRMRGFKISILPNSTVVVRLGKLESVSKIHGFLDKNQDWLKKCLEKTNLVQSQYPQLCFVEGEAYRFLGENYFLKYEKTDKKISVEIKKPYMTIKVPEKLWRNDFSNYPHPQFRKQILKFYETAAERVLPKRVKELSELTGLRPTRISLRKQRTLWGSCSPSGSIQLNWKLISAPINVIDYVIIHELAHLKHPNHSKRFWNEVAVYCPYYKQIKLWLKKHYYSFDHLNETSELHSTKWKSDFG